MPRTVLVLLLVATVASSTLAGDWPQWRGPRGDGVSDEVGLPVRWDERTGIVWKCPLPEQGNSSPCIRGDAIFLTVQEGDALKLLKIAKKTGKVEWTRQVGAAEVRRMPLRGKRGDERREQRFHALHNMASPTPATDGRLVVAHFGNGDLAAYDFAGKELWRRNLQKDHGTYTIWWGHANSPVLYGDLVIVVAMQDSLADLQEDKVPSYVAAYDKHTGELRWKTLRMTRAQAEECDSYTTPVLLRRGSRVEMIVLGGNQLDAYDPATGKQLWYLQTDPRGRTITGATVADGMIFGAQGMRGPLLAVKPGGPGALSPDAIVWKHVQGTPDSSSPVVWKGLLFWVSDDGIAHCVDARTGELKWKERLGGDFKASPLAAEGRVYFLNKVGRCTVVAAVPKFEVLATNQLDDETIASPAVSDGRLYIRGRKALYCIGGM